jgi:hypothetical protein
MALLLMPLTARANVGPPALGGHVVAEPVGIADMEILDETLTIDLRPLTRNELVRVEAVYHLHNRAAEKTLDLLFASGSAVMANFQVTLDDRPLASRSAPAAPLPPSWRAPNQTPGIGKGSALEYLHYRPREVKPVAFTATIPPGRHSLEVRYAAEAATHLLGSPTVYRQFAYVLAPAHAWSGFGGLDVTVHVPPGWLAASAPALNRDGDTLRERFTELPADALALTVQAPGGWAHAALSYGSLSLLGLVLLGGPVVMWWGGRARGRSLLRPRSSGRRGWAWPISIALCLGWAAALLGTGLVAIFAPDWVLPADQISHYGYGQALALIGVVLLTALAVPFGFLIAQVTAVVVREANRGEDSSARLALPSTDNEA